jgi:hypothetical protein
MVECSPAAWHDETGWHLTFIAGGATGNPLYHLYRMDGETWDSLSRPIAIRPAKSGFVYLDRLATGEQCPTENGLPEPPRRPKLMLVDNVLVRPQGQNQVVISWTSDDENAISWVFINGQFAFGPFMAETKQRSVDLTVPQNATYKIDIHDFLDRDEIPASIEQAPLVQPVISWNKVDAAMCYRVYHTIFDTGTIESRLIDTSTPPMNRIEIDCPVKLEGKGGRWHSFRVESVDQFGNESANEVVPHFAVDLPPSPEFTVSRDTETGLLTFRIH